MNIPLPSPVLHAIQLLNDAGYEAYAVGGCVRDSLMGKVPDDWDVTTAALPEQTLAVFADYRTIETGIRHGTVTVLIDGTPLEITTYRTDGAYSDGRHPDTVAFTPSLQEDLKRRDFTVNAMAYHPQKGLVDLYDGQKDLQEGIVRCVGEPIERFTEDALRILRALRFASVLGFSIEPATADALRRRADTLTCVSVERISTEFQKLLCGMRAEDVLTEYREIIEVFLPEIHPCRSFTRISSMAPIPYARLALLFYDAGVFVKDAVAALNRLRLDHQTIQNVSDLLSVDAPVRNERKALLRLLNRLGPALTFDYLRLHESDTATVKHLQSLLDAQVCYRLSMLAVSGDDLIARGVPAGPAIGVLLNQLLDAVIDGTCPNDKVALLTYVDTLKKPVP